MTKQSDWYVHSLLSNQVDTNDTLPPPVPQELIDRQLTISDMMREAALREGKWARFWQWVAAIALMFSFASVWLVIKWLNGGVW